MVVVAAVVVVVANSVGVVESTVEAEGLNVFVEGGEVGFGVPSEVHATATVASAARTARSLRMLLTLRLKQAKRAPPSLGVNAIGRIGQPQKTT